MANDPIIVKSQAAGPAATVEAVIAAIAARRDPVVLDSADSDPGRGRYTIIAFDPLDVVSCPAEGSDPFETMRTKIAQTRLYKPPQTELTDGVGFPCGWIGYFAYEAGRYIEDLPATTADDIPLPIARFGLYDTVAIHDACFNRWTLIAAHLGQPSRTLTSHRPPEDRLAEWEQILENAQNPKSFDPLPPIAAAHNMTRNRYIDMVRRARQYIAAGDIFQVNLARRETFPVHEPAFITYLRLRRTNPGAYAAFMSWQDSQARPAAILSASPELFLHLKDNKEIITRPIKGTRPRSIDPVTDQAYKMELADSPKDRAELAMIVDLERNDLGRVCEYGSIRVAADNSSPAHPYVLETHPTIHHLVADVVGRLADKYQAIDLLRACFPGGSITGAPKVRAMQIIDELEPTERSVYTGAIGYFGLDGSMMLNIAIRTIILADQKLHIYAGGGIVADSDPEAEFEETEAKILGLRRALGAAGRLEPAATFEKDRI